MRRRRDQNAKINTKATKSCCYRYKTYDGAAPLFQILKMKFPTLRILLSLPFAATIASAGTMWVDVTGGGTATGTSANHPFAESPDKAVDDSFYTKYLNFDELNTGVIISGANAGAPVTRMILATAGDASERDPASYTLEGSNDGINWTSIASGALALPTVRNTSIVNSGVANQSLTFANTTAYSSYRVIFPTVRNAAAANSMQIGEISLLGLYDPGADVLDMQSYTAGFVGTNNFPGGESPAQAIDNNVDTKYLHFGKEGNGLLLTTAGSASIINAISLSHAGDAPARDVTGFTLRGSTDGINFTDIVTNQPLVSGMGLFEGTTVSFANSTAYRDYQFVVTSLRASASANSFQFSEIQLHGSLIPEPGAAMLGLTALAGLLRRRRR
jgi:hypothetical protein